VGQDSDKEQIEKNANSMAAIPMETRRAAHVLLSEDTDMLAAEVQTK
jgi:hypothetical protein